ncbi:low molecular weight phosphatase family protein [Microbacterium sp. AG157]|uniref:arsenate reductase/protein-tyrosine-phosphatase family protein n=1 Tax=Microbacterium sp. AG157 TaxID=2183993 RepID=UPI002163A8C2|nr:low molecular weight phosphatase family protein [Microbacterium sp. AG157]
MTHALNLLGVWTCGHPRSASRRSSLLNILAVCTGNVCRSPLAEQLLTELVSGFDVSVSSAGTRARGGVPMTTETAEIAVTHGCDPRQVESHRARALTDEHLRSAHLALAMAREHRREIVETNPSVLRRTFTVRELSRLLADVSDDQLREESTRASGPLTPENKFSAMLLFAASRRGLVLPPAMAEDDDIVDPYRRSSRTYALSTEQLTSALPVVLRLVRLAHD